MGFRKIIVDATPRSDLYPKLEQAREVGEKFSAKLSVVSYAWPHFSLTDVVMPNAVSTYEQNQSMQEALKESRDVFERVFGPNHDDVEWCSGVTHPAGPMQEHLLVADLLITSSSETDRCIIPDPAELALRSGTPVLRLSRQGSSSIFENVLVAWKDRSQSRRALHDSLPFLKRAKDVALVGVGDEVAVERLEEVARYLACHQVTARLLHIPRSDAGVCADLIKQAQKGNASLIVAGAYSHGPLSERILGSVTRELLKETQIAWFLSH